MQTTRGVSNFKLHRVLQEKIPTHLRTGTFSYLPTREVTRFQNVLQSGATVGSSATQTLKHTAEKTRERATSPSLQRRMRRCLPAADVTAVAAGPTIRQSPQRRRTSIRESAFGYDNEDEPAFSHNGDNETKDIQVDGDIDDEDNSNAVDVSDLEAGTVYAGWYIVKRIGGGASGAVYEVKDMKRRPGLSPNQHYALKVDLFGSSNPDEGKIALSLYHPNIVRTLLAETSPHGDALLVQELLSGGNLAMWIARHPVLTGVTVDTESREVKISEADARKKRRPLATSEVRERVMMLAGVAAGLRYMHEQKLVHGDVKPENVLLSAPSDKLDCGNIKLGDLGHARYAPLQTDETKRVRHEGGDPAYEAPEVQAGEPYGYAADLWSLGVTGWELFFSPLLWSEEFMGDKEEDYDEDDDDGEESKDSRPVYANGLQKGQWTILREQLAQLYGRDVTHAIFTALDNLMHIDPRQRSLDGLAKLAELLRLPPDCRPSTMTETVSVKYVTTPRYEPTSVYYEATSPQYDEPVSTERSTSNDDISRSANDDDDYPTTPAAYPTDVYSTLPRYDPTSVFYEPLSPRY